MISQCPNWVLGRRKLWELIAVLVIRTLNITLVNLRFKRRNRILAGEEESCFTNPASTSPDLDLATCCCYFWCLHTRVCSLGTFTLLDDGSMLLPLASEKIFFDSCFEAAFTANCLGLAYNTKLNPLKNATTFHPGSPFLRAHVIMPEGGGLNLFLTNEADSPL